MTAPMNQVVRFGPFELDLRTGELRKSGVRVNLPEQPFQVLKALLDRPGDLITREELRLRLWPAETFVDFEHGLNAAVRRLREALGDSAETPRFVETLPRRGYRFIAPVVAPAVAEEPALPTPALPTPAPPSEDGHDASTAPDPIASHHRRGRAGQVGVAASLLALAVALSVSGFLVWRLAASPSTPSTTRFMLAVLPFENLTGDPDQEYISDGMTEELIAQLGSMNPASLGVIARQSAMQFKKTTRRADQIGSELGVSHLVEGSLRRVESRVRIAVQLIDAASESQLWAEQYERNAENLLTLQREVAEAITRQITASLGVARSPVHADSRRHSTSAEAYDHYLRGRHHWLQDTAAGYERAKEHFRDAIELDPSYANAHAGLAETYTALGSVGFLPMSEAYARGRAAAHRALELDDTLAEAHATIASVARDYDWDWTTADRHYRRAIELSPNDLETLVYYSSFVGFMGRHEEAIGLAVRARDLNPVSSDAWLNLGIRNYLARRYDDAITQFREALDLDPSYGAAHVFLGRTYAAKGLSDRAVEELDRAKSVLGARPDVTTPHAYVLAKAGRRRDALAMLEELRRITKPRDPSPFRLAYIHLGLGETDQAFEWLAKAVDARDWQMVMLNVEPAFDGVRTDARFAALVKRVGLPTDNQRR